MRSVNIRELKTNPSAALRMARKNDLVVVMNRDQPRALLVDLSRLNLPDTPGVKLAIAAALFRQGHVSLGYASRIAGRTLPDMVNTLGHMGIPIAEVGGPELDHDIEALDAWRKGIPV